MDVEILIFLTEVNVSDQMYKVHHLLICYLHPLFCANIMNYIADL